MNIILNKCGHDPFIDFLKGWAIICVVITHAISNTTHDVSLFFLWGDWAVPIFLLIQVFHAYKKGLSELSYNWEKLARRIFIPFFFITIVMLSLDCLIALYSSSTLFPNFIVNTLKSGGIGPGCYYPWIYLQFSLILPILCKFLNIRYLLGGCFLR